MSDAAGWRPLQQPSSPRNAGFEATPFTRLARVHAIGAAADGMIAVALAGSIFFSIDPSAARWRVALYLLLSIAPFAVVTPLIGPAIDRVRGGRRTMILATAFSRALVAFLMAGHIKSILLFPLAFLMLVLQKAYSVAKSAVVPKLVDSELQLVEANSKLALLSSLGTMAGAGIGGLLTLLGGPSWSATFAVFGYAAGGVAALQLPRVAVASQPIEAHERAELRAPGILLAASSMGVLRGVVGFLTFLLAFEFRGGKDGVDIKPLGAAAGAATAVARKVSIVGDPGAPAWHFGAVVVAAGLGALVGAKLAPQLRQHVHEENMLLTVLGLTALAGVVAAWESNLFAAVLLSLVVAFAAAAGKLAFDSLVQRDAPDANYGRSFARFEARFQLTWVVGAFIPVVVPLPAWVGYTIVALAAGFATVSYVLGVRAQHEAAAEGGAQPEVAAVAPHDRTAVFEQPPAGEDEPSDSETSGSPDVTTVMQSGDGDRTLVYGASQAEPAESAALPGGAEQPGEAEQPEAPVPERDQAASPSWPSWADAPVKPVVSSVEGVEIDPDVAKRSRR